MIISTGLYGHTAVYHFTYKAIYVFGGYEYQTDGNKPSDNLYALQLSNLSWQLLAPHPSSKVSESLVSVLCSLIPRSRGAKISGLRSR